MDRVCNQLGIGGYYMRTLYYVELVLKVPSEEGRKADFRTKTSDIITAVTKFNQKYDFKKIKIREVESQKIILFFAIDLNSYDVPVSARDLSFFSKRLYHDFNWKIFSREGAKLFTAAAFTYVEEEEHLRSFDQAPAVPDSIKDLKVDEESLEDDVHDLITDEEALKLFEVLLSIQDIGDDLSIQARKKYIGDIKMTLLNAFKIHGIE